jgi:phosphoribosyl-ATP pyrophosphohydrolase/phosphoribosyl-AMP cyclohydrolase
MKLNFNKNDGLIPAIIQDVKTGKVLMLAYMNKEAYKKTLDKGKVTFYSRSRKTIWTKGETSGNYLNLVEMIPDCDQDTLLIKVDPTGPVCHTGKETCFNEINTINNQFLFQLENIIKQRKNLLPLKSYTTELFKAGIGKISQKLGEECIELIIDTIKNNYERTKEECADMLYHLLVLLCAQNISMDEVIDVLEKRHRGH